MLRRLLAISTALLTMAAAPPPAKPAANGHYLYVWTGDQAKQGNDFLLVLDADPASPTYGKMVTALATDQKSDRIHHTEYEMPASGMLFANDHGANRTFIFDLREPLQPKIAASFESMAGYSMPHSFLRLPNGHVLASFQFVDRNGQMDMEGRSGGIVEIDDSGKVVRSAASKDSSFPGDATLPYSLAILPKIDRVLVTDSPMGNDYLLTSNSYQLFRLSDLKLLGTWRLDPGPALDGHISPEEVRVGPDDAAYIQTLSCGVERVTDMETPTPTAKLVHKFPGEFCGVPTVIGHYWVQSVPAIHGYIVLDIADGANPKEVSRLTINDRYDPHWTGWDAKAKRLVVTSGQSGDRMYLLKLDEKTGALTLDEAFRDTDGQVGFSFASRTWPTGWTGEGKPHGAVFSR